MACIAPKYFHREITTDKWDGSAAKLISVDIQEPVFAVQIGPESDIDRCWIFSGGEADAILAPTADSQVRHNAAFRLGQKLSVECPYIGYLDRGPYKILLPYARSTIVLAGVLERGSPIVGDTGWPSSMYGISDAGEGQIGLDPLLQLVFHRMPPTWLPTKRPTAEWVFSVDAWSTLGAPISHTARVPGFGRDRVSLSLKLKDVTGGGTLDWSFIGVNAMDPGANDTQIHRETLASGAAIAANFDETYFFDGEYDYYELTVTESAAFGAGTDLQAIVKLRD